MLVPAIPGQVVDKSMIVLLEQDFVGVRQALPQSHTDSERVIFVILQLFRWRPFSLIITNQRPLMILKMSDLLTLLLVDHVLVLLLLFKKRVYLLVVVDP